MTGEDCRKVSVYKPSEFIYEIEIPSTWVLKYGIVYISENSISDFIEMQDKLFKKELYQYINGVLDFKQRHNKNNKTEVVAKMKEVALVYLEKNGFTEEDVKFETIKKGYQRYKTQNTRPMFKPI
jgi:hypothetical protein